MEHDLTTNETRVLLALGEHGAMSPENLAGATGLNGSAALSAALGLQEDELARVVEEEHRFARLTEEGREYASGGLPERQVLEDISGPTPMREVMQFPKAKIALGWLKKKNWAKIEDGMLKPIGDAPRGEDEEALESMLNGPVRVEELGEDVVDELRGRNLIVVEEERTRTIEPTSKGLKLVEEGVSVEEVVTRLTPEMIRSGSWRGKRIRSYDVEAMAKPRYPGKKHPYQRMLDEMRSIFLEMGFTEIKGDIVQSSYWNFDALFQPQDHPAREMQDTFYLDTEADLPGGWERVRDMHEYGGDLDSTGWGEEWSPDLARREVLRTHTTAVTIKYLAEHRDPPVKAFCIDRAYRRETIDPTHTPEFEQLEGVVMDENMSFANLLGLLEEFYHHMGFEDVRFRPAYFPYTEPSVEPEVYIEELGWVELGGAGIFRKEVTEPLGIEYPVLAWGLGVGRVAMLRLGLTDLRELYQSDIKWLRETPIGGGW